MERIENGIIYNDNGSLGTAKKDLKFGYHPAVIATVSGKSEWFELDEPDLLAKIADWAREQDKKEKPFRNYVCEKCGYTVMAQETPAPIKWTDGHVCRFTVVE